ncbi:unnamed protein product [Polarella glacialis]|uniref:Uncharacterized protein n=1 Tax=Polarella glacialis TaxID=89957 RepID=A0A813GLI2_POLGL|nr:unnamed protein product [Polarella glacialis]CAE8626138.1 unnamed protein product [Polarella glacialis]
MSNDTTHLCCRRSISSSQEGVTVKAPQKRQATHTHTAMMMVAYLAVLAASCRSASGFSTHRSPVLDHARMGPALTISVSRPKSTALRAGKKPSQSYSDDAFGFVFFASALLARDEVFAATFVAVSAVAATLTVAGKLEGGKRVPAGVAAATLLSTPVISAALAQFGVVASDPNPSARLVELGLCSVSIAYGLWRSRDAL